MFELFLEHNPWSEVVSTPVDVVVKKPWGDDSFELAFPTASAVPADDVLSNLILPLRFEGIHHLESHTLELFFTQLAPTDPLLQKTFQFIWRGTQFSCRYAESSPEAVLLAKHFRAENPELDSEYRGLGRINRLRVFELLGELPEELRETVITRTPASFFVEGISTFVESDVVALAKHLNLYMSYFWRRTPTVSIRDVSPQELGTLPPPRPTSLADLPPAISATEIDPYVLDLLLTARLGSARLRFIQYYQVLEYTAFYWTEESVRTAVRRIMAAPDLLTRLDEYVPRVIDALAPTRANDDHKIRRVIETFIDPRLLWPEIAPSLKFFSEPLRFDGGFSLDPLVSANCTADAFTGMWGPKLSDALRLLRNALVHGRESRMQAVIAPTIANDRRLLPWLPLISRVAEEVAIHSGGPAA